MNKSVFDQPDNFTNRELSWLEFNQRILGEARDRKNPLFERMKFLSITASNLDEFFMVRIASLKDMVNAGYQKKDIAGMTAQEQLRALNEKMQAFCEKQYTTYNRALLPKLSEEGLEIISFSELSEKEMDFLEEYFHKNIYPVLTPMAIDSSRPFPLIQNKTLNIAALIKSRNKDKKEKKEWLKLYIPARSSSPERWTKEKMQSHFIGKCNRTLFRCPVPQSRDYLFSALPYYEKCGFIN